VVAQAVSWSKAIQTGVWYGDLGAAPRAPAGFDFDQIESLAHEAADHNRAWRRWFTANQIVPLPIRYEDLVSDKVALTRRALAFLGLEASDGVAIVEQTRKQRDALNDEWVRRFQQIAASPNIKT
jgi:trehalose 2-sulfotransferase